MQQTCQQCSAAFEITEGDLKFYEDVSPVIGGAKQSIPPPKLCPDCRFQRRLTFRNERRLYHRKSDLSGRQIVSMYAPDKPYIVYDQDEFWSDRWDECTYGRDFDFSRTFSEQFTELGLVVPHMSLFTTNVENSYYTNHTLNCRNCYLLFGGGNDEDCLFSRFMSGCKDTVDALSLYFCQWCYEAIASQECYRCFFLQNCRNCSDCLMVEDCTGCKNCICCFGLNNKEYCVLNELIGKEAFERRKAELGILTNTKIAALRAQLEQFRLQLPHRASHIYGSESCTGDMLFNSRNCEHAFDSTDCENCKFICYTPKGSNSQDCTYNAPDGVQWCYNVGSSVGTMNAMSTFLSWYGDSLYYSRECHHCSDIFGCISMRRKKYCILNKQYTKEEYEQLVPKIIEHMRKTGEWGEYFHPSLSYMGYNETVADELLPLPRETVLRNGWRWYDGQEKKEAYLGPLIPVPEDITSVGDDICESILTCSVSGKPFKIIPQELKFYRTMGLPLPTICPDERHKKRVARRNPRKLWSRKCAKCEKAIETTYSPERPEIVYCEECYLKTVY